MPREKGDAALLWDMLEAARSVVELTAGCTEAQYLEDRKTRLAVERSVEIIGEAARNVSQAFQEAHAEIPWRKIVGMRHVLAHEYAEIRQDVLWRIATERVPELIQALERLIPPPPPEPGV